ncbi:MAG: cadmium-translocating P-type ATPase [Oscillospiraceae bacterium]|nr:cadmium-translocating P-type ATPase [Oscillospiraceae bacterium]
MTKQNKRDLCKILAAAALFVLGNVVKGGEVLRFAFFFAAFIVAGGEVLANAVRNIRYGQVFDEEFLMTIATIGAFCVGEYPEGAAVMLFFQVGELFQSYAVNKSRKSISDLMDIRPDYANVLVDGETVKKDPYDVKVGDIIVINPGERVPLDSVVVKGESSLDTSALTGESLPRDVEAGSEILSGCININGVITAVVEKAYGESTVNRILDLVENASNKKSKSEKFITKFARVYTPAVCGVALALAVIPSLITGQWSVWVYRALSFLVVSCPCALVISVPLSFFGGLGGASKQGVLVKGSNYLETMAQVKTVVFDKTGTLTKGRFEVVAVNAVDGDKDALVNLAALCENASNHPIALCIKNAAGKIDAGRVSNIKEQAGFGVVCTADGKETLVGSEKLMQQHNISGVAQHTALGSVVHIAQDGRYLGNIVVADVIKDDAKQLVANLKAMGITNTVMLTGDVKSVGEKIASDLGIDTVVSELLPHEKVEHFERILEQNTNGKVCYVGDGINDAPVLARADIGIAMGALGSDAAIEAADVVIMNDEISKITTAIKVAQKTLTIVKQNIIFAIGVKLAVLLFVAAGLATMWWAVFADVGVAVIAILNAVRALDTKNM